MGGLEENKKKELELGSALWRNIYQSDPKTPDECVYNLTDYVRNQLESFYDHLSDEDLFQAKLNWMDLDSNDASALFEGDWREAISVTGKTYYWNVKTRESRWSNPDNREWFKY